MNHEHPNELVRALTVTRYSRREVLKSLAALSAVAMLPSLPGRSALAQTAPPATSELDRRNAQLAAYMTAWLAVCGDDPKEKMTLRNLRFGSPDAAELITSANGMRDYFDERERGEAW
jgi:hypothetical protein